MTSDVDLAASKWDRLEVPCHSKPLPIPGTNQSPLEAHGAFWSSRNMINDFQQQHLKLLGFRIPYTLENYGRHKELFLMWIVSNIYHIRN